MGPRSDERGKFLDIVKANNADKASMGPRSDERGKDVKLVLLGIVGGASMGPRSDERGKSGCLHGVLAPSQSFNGAAFG